MLAKGIVGVGRNQIEFRDVEIGEHGEWDLLVNVECSAISVGTEVRCLATMDEQERSAYVSGYAPVARVAEAGEKAREQFPVGSRVTYFAPRPPAKASGIVQLCGGHVSPAIIDVDPAERDLLGPDTYCVPVPEDLASEHAAFAGVSAVSYLGVKMCDPAPGDKVLVLGQGIIGLYATQHYALRGAEVVVADTYPMRLDAARACGADLAIDVTQHDAADVARERWPGGADIVADTTGIYGVIDESLPALKRFGKYVFLGVCGGAEFDVGRLQGTRVFDAFFPWTLQGDLVAASMNLMAKGLLKVDPLISHRFRPDQAGEAFEFVRAARDRYTGILFDWREEA